MRIFSKKSFQFDHPTSAALFVIVMAGAFADVPDWVPEATMFKLASQDGDVEVIGSKKDEKAAETGNKAKTAAEKKAEAEAKKEARAKLDDEIKENVTGFTSLPQEEQISVLQGQGVEPGASLDERVQQYTGLLQKELAAANQ